MLFSAYLHFSFILIVHFNFKIYSECKKKYYQVINIHGQEDDEMKRREIRVSKRQIYNIVATTPCIYCFDLFYRRVSIL